MLSEPGKVPPLWCFKEDMRSPALGRSFEHCPSTDGIGEDILVHFCVVNVYACRNGHIWSVTITPGSMDVNVFLNFPRTDFGVSVPTF